MAIRWPALLLLCGFAGIFLLIGLIQSLGFFGSTSLRSVSVGDKAWTDFTGLFGSSKGKPYSWNNDKKPEIGYGIVKFDKRTIRALTYLSKPNQVSCGWSGQHEKITLSIEDTAISSLSPSPDNLRSASTIDRGLGVRVVSADKIKCTKVPKNKYCDTKVPLQAEKFDHKSIPLVIDKVLEPNKPHANPDCDYICAVDYYPNSPVDGIDESTPPTISGAISSLNPGEFQYADIASNGKKAGIYKTALLSYELMTIDDKGCETTDGNEGYKRVIPTTLILSKWVTDEMGNLWKGFEKLAEDKFPYKFQMNSRLSGLSSDPLLDERGLHFNY